MVEKIGHRPINVGWRLYILPEVTKDMDDVPLSYGVLFVPTTYRDDVPLTCGVLFVPYIYMQ